MTDSTLAPARFRPRGERCSTCWGRWWWSERDAPRRGWRCIPAPAGVGIAGRIAGRLFDLANVVRRLAPPGHRDPERFHIEKSELAAELRRVAHDAQRRPLD